MAKVAKRVKSDWSIGAHTVNAYKKRVGDPALKRNRRNAREIRRVLAQALNRAKQSGKTVYLSASDYRGNPKPKTLYQVELFKQDFYLLCVQNQVISLFTSQMIENDAQRGGLVFRDEMPFDELSGYYDR